MKTYEAWKVVKTLVERGATSSWFLRGAPGTGKSAIGAVMLREIVARKGGVYIGWCANDVLVVTDPPEGEPWEADWSDPRAPRVTKGTPFLLARHFFVPGASPLDFRGVTIPAMKDNADARTYWSRPAILAGMPDKAKCFALVLDEIAKCPELYPLLSTLLLGGKSGEHSLPGESHVVVGLGNRVKDRAGARSLTTDLVNRMNVIDVEPDPNADLGWARGWAPGWATAFAASDLGKAIIYAGEVPDLDEPFASPRSFWSYVSDLHHLLGDDAPASDDHVAVEMAQARLGASATSKMFAWLTQVIDLPSVETVFRDPHSAPVPDRIDLQIVMSELLISAAVRGDKQRIAQRMSCIVQYMTRLKHAAQMSSIGALRSFLGVEQEDRNKLDKMTAEQAAVVKAIGAVPELRSMWLLAN